MWLWSDLADILAQPVSPGQPCTLEKQHHKAGKKKAYTTTVETLLFVFPGLWGSMVYSILSGPMVYTLFPCFPRKMVYTIACFALWPRGRATDRERRGATVVVYTRFFPVKGSTGLELLKLRWWHLARNLLTPSTAKESNCHFETPRSALAEIGHHGSRHPRGLALFVGLSA